jgi:hypothetical protein
MNGNLILILVGLVLLGLSTVALNFYKKLANKINISADVLEGLSISGITVGGMGALMGALWLVVDGDLVGSEHRSSFAQARKDANNKKESDLNAIKRTHGVPR